MGKGQLQVAGIVGRHVLRRVAGITTGRSSLEDVVEVAGGARQRGVGPGKRKTGEFKVIEFSREPRVHGVAVLAGDWKAQCAMVKIGRQIIALMAGIACGGKAFVLAGGSPFVAFRAVGKGMGSHQGKAVLVVLDHVERDVPTLDGVALLAVSAELAAVNVGVTVGAMGAYIVEHQAGVALRTTNFAVHTPQRITGLIVVEFRQGANWLPAGEGVAVLTGQIHRPVRIDHLRAWRVACLARRFRRTLYLHPEQDGHEAEHYRKQPTSFLQAPCSKQSGLATKFFTAQHAVNFRSHHQCEYPTTVFIRDANSEAGRKRATKRKRAL